MFSLVRGQYLHSSLHGDTHWSVLATMAALLLLMLRQITGGPDRLRARESSGSLRKSL